MKSVTAVYRKVTPDRSPTLLDIQKYHDQKKKGIYT
jgi:hypothetical protein